MRCPRNGVNFIPPGNYTVSARATDNDGLTATASASILVTAPGNTVVMGSTAEGTTTDYITDSSGAYINANRFQAASSRDVAKVRAKLGMISGKYKVAIYADDNGNPGQLLRASGEITPTVDGWQTFALSSPLPVASGASYWLAIWSNDTAARVYATGGGSVRWGQYNYSAAWPTPAALNGAAPFTYSIYATD
jgi:hypothetical protein